MMLKFLLLAYLLQMAVALPQFITYKDGKFGVNFGGYHAEAGLGGLLTGDAAHGGLSASAGTPHGQRAGAGLGGSVDGNAAGLLYAGAEANPQVGAAAVLGGDTNKGGFMGAQAFSNGKTVASTKSHTFTRTKSHNSQLETMGNDEPVSVDVKSDVESVHTVQKVKPPKKYHVQKHRITVHNRADDIQTVAAATSTKTSNHNEDNNDDDNTAATATTKKTILPNVVDVQYPERSNTAAVDVGSGTTKSVKRNNSQQKVENAPQSSYAEWYNKKDVAAPLPPPPPSSSSASIPTIVVTKQRLRQKSRLRTQHKLQRQLKRQREQAQHATDIEARVGSRNTQQQKQQQRDALVQQYAQYYTPNTEVNVPPKTKYLIKNVEQPQLDYPAAPASTETKVNIRPAVVTSALQIPIGILRSLQESLGGLSVAKQGSVQIN
ncbi:uncharacterized protein [Eurosta solidaginis]|uniref:uncharacterized protein n=1 Tax=Eurosta solidaginis TaxID=178769 RepID=UPI003530CEF8